MRHPTDWPQSWREAWEERAAIMQYHGGLGRHRAECLAAALLRDDYRQRVGRRYGTRRAG